MRSFVVFLSGEISPTPLLRKAVAGRRAIAADAGLRHAAALGIVPEVLVGDFDSTEPALLRRFAAVERLTLARDKAETDGASALSLAVERGAADILVVGALGGPRTDHVFSNLVTAMAFAALVETLTLFDGREWVFPLRPGRPLRIDAAPGAQLSICRFSDVRGLTIRGVKWPLEAVTLPFESILTQSNETLGPTWIELAEGRAMAILSAGDGD